MRDLAVLFIHLITTIARLAGPGGARSVVAESVLVKQRLRTASPLSVFKLAMHLAYNPRSLDSSRSKEDPVS
jgi:hypothetical protein